MDYPVKNVAMNDEFKICPSCGYEDGFHSMFKKEGAITRWLFICPSCHQVFDIGLTVSKWFQSACGGLRPNGPPIFVADCRPPINAHPPESVADCAFLIGLRLAFEPDLRF